MISVFPLKIHKTTLHILPNLCFMKETFDELKSKI